MSPRFRFRSFLFSWILVLTIPYALQAALFSGQGTTGANFLKIPMSARGTGLSGAGTALFNDVTALEYNPAGLRGTTRFDMNLTFIPYLESSSFQSASFAYPFRFDSGSSNTNKARTQKPLLVGFEYRGFKANDITRNDLGVEDGDFSIQDQLFHLALAYDVAPGWTFGAGGKLVNSTLQNYSRSWIMGDVGLLWKQQEKITLGASLLNVGPDKSFISQTEAAPTLARVGVGFQLKSLLASADASIGRDNIVQPALGLEYKIGPYLILRGGGLYHTNPELSAGVGIRFSNPLQELSPAALEKKSNRATLDDLDISQSNPVYIKNSTTSSTLDFGFDYAFQTHSDLDVSHTFTLKILY